MAEPLDPGLRRRQYEAQDQALALGPLREQLLAAQVQGAQQTPGLSLQEHLLKQQELGIRSKAQQALERYQQGMVGARTAAAGQKAPPSWRWTPDGGLEPVPGGPADVKGREAIDKQLEAKKTVDKTLVDEMALIDKIIGTGKPGKGGKEHPGLTSAVGTIDPYILTVLKPTANFEALMDSLKSKASIGALQTIRASNAGSVGAITEREWPILQSYKASLTLHQGEKAFRQNLSEYRDRLQAIKSETDDAIYKLAPRGTETATGGGWDTNKQRRYETWKKQKGLP